MPEEYPVFWTEPTEWERVWLRRYHSGTTCPLPHGYHHARVLLTAQRTAEHHPIGDPELLHENGYFSAPSKEDLRWPTHCDCGYQFQHDDRWQVFVLPLYRGAPDGQLYTLPELPVGAMWDADWMRGANDNGWNVGPDGISLFVRLPDGSDWCVDAEASNCTQTQYGPKIIEGVAHAKVWLGRTHYCWVRHGDPRKGWVHVDKTGVTCSAGAGSIQTKHWHGFLDNGYLRTQRGR